MPAPITITSVSIDCMRGLVSSVPSPVAGEVGEGCAGCVGYPLSTASGAAATSRDCRATTLVAVTSAVTLPRVAKASGKVSTASIRPNGPTGRPIDCATGRLVAMKVTAPGRPTEPRLITTASTAPAMSWVADRSTPYAQAMNAAEVRYCTGLVRRHSVTAIGSTSALTCLG